MTTTTEHLAKIRAKCVELLAIAEKRTQGKWWHRHNGHYDEIQAEDHQYSPSIGLTSPMPERAANAAFIASCAGPAEAAFKSTIAAIDGLELITNDIYGGHLCDNDDRGCGACQEAERIQAAIISAWPEELLRTTKTDPQIKPCAVDHRPFP